MQQCRMSRRRPGRGLVARLFQFGGLQLLSIFAPLVLLPLVARDLGPKGWAAFAVAQAVGAMGASVVMFGWQISGQASVSLSKDVSEQAGLYARSIRSRGVLLLVTAPCVLAVSWALCGWQDASLVALAGMSTLLLSVSPNWYAVAVGRPWLILYDSLPKIVATVIAAGCIVFGSPAVVYPALLCTAAIGGFLAFNVAVFHQWVPIQFEGWRELLFRSHMDWRGAVYSIVGGVYVAAALPVAGALSVPGLAGLASIDRLFRYSLLAVIALGNAGQHWALSESAGRPQRIETAIRAHVAIGLCGLVGIGTMGPAVTELMFGAGAHASAPASWGYGVAFLAVSWSTPLMRLLLAPIGSSALVSSTWLMFVVGGASVVGFGAIWGSAGVAWGIAAGYCVALVAMLSASRRLRCRSAAEPSHPMHEAPRGPETNSHCPSADSE